MAPSRIARDRCEQTAGHTSRTAHPRLSASDRRPASIPANPVARRCIAEPASGALTSSAADRRRGHRLQAVLEFAVSRVPPQAEERDQWRTDHHGDHCRQDDGEFQLRWATANHPPEKESAGYVDADERQRQNDARPRAIQCASVSGRSTCLGSVGDANEPFMLRPCPDLNVPFSVRRKRRGIPRPASGRPRKGGLGLACACRCKTARRRLPVRTPLPLG